jgi:adenylosuccinate lyase
VPYYGATQILPRSLYVPLASALCSLVCIIEKIGLDIRLGARSPYPIYQEPFAKKQKGSSAMPHKRNPINTEKLMGLGRMARGYLSMLVENIITWEERAIEQSSVERVAWPDLFHVALHSVEVIAKMLVGLKVYPDNMMRELVESRGTYAASQAKEVLKDMGGQGWIDAEEAYRLIQLAAFNIMRPSAAAKDMREQLAKSFSLADQFLVRPESFASPYITIKEVIERAELEPQEELEATPEQVERWNTILREIFSEDDNRRKWDNIFKPSVLLANEETLYRKISESDE